MIAIWLAAVSAVLWGTADYCGGRAAQRGDALAVTVGSQIVGLPVLLAGVVWLAGRPHPVDLAWGVVGGLAGLYGIVLLYQGLASGAMVSVAPITAVTAALVPMTVGLIGQRLPSGLALSGAVCAVAAIGLVSVGHAGASGRVTGRTVGLALTAGLMFGVVFVLLAQTGDDSGIWPLAGMRWASITLGLAVLARRGVSWRLPRPVITLAAGAGVGDIVANAFFLIAVRGGLLSVVAPIAALYPVSTVLLALGVDKERVRPVQVAGLGLAATALVLTAV